MATVTLLAKARQGRLAALASLQTRDARTDNVVSIFDFAFDDQPHAAPTARSNVIAFRSRRALPAAQDRTVARAA